MGSGGLFACTGGDSALVDGIGNCLGCSGVTGNVPGGPACRAGFGSGVFVRICSVRETKDVCVLSKMLVTNSSSCESPASGEGALGTGEATLVGACDCDCVRAGGKVTEWPFI